MKKSTASVFILCAAVCWGVIGIATRAMSACGFSSFQICAIRCILTAVILVVWLLFRNPSMLRVSFRDLWMFFGTGVCSILFFNVCYFTTIELTTLSAASILLYTAPVFVMLMSALFFREKINLRKLAALLLAITGCFLVAGGIDTDNGISALGFLTGIGAGFGYALYSIFGHVALQKYHSLTLTTYTFVVAGICALPFCRFTQITERCTTSPSVLLAVLFLCIVSTVLPYILYTEGLRHTEPGHASVMASAEPIVAALIGCILYNEPFTLMGTLGAVLVLVSIILLNLPTSVNNAESSPVDM